MIEYLEIRNSSLEIVGIIDTAQSIIWHSVYFGVGDFEIYLQPTAEQLNVLQKDNYITHPDRPTVGIIEHVENTENAQDGKMFVISGRFAKSILDRRHIYRLSGTSNKATVLRGNVESAARALVANNAISCTFDTSRNIPVLELGTNAGLTPVIVDESGNPTQKQVSYENLLEYTDKLLEEYGMSAEINMNETENKLQYICYMGDDRSVNNTTGNEPVIFSRDYDNLTGINYLTDDTTYKNTALIGGEGEGTQRFYSLISGAYSGLSRRETFVDASSISKTYTDDEEQEHTYSNAEYRAMLNAQGIQELAQMTKTETLDGEINVTFGQWQLDRDFFLGDIVTVQDKSIWKYIDVRITEITEVQDENGYSIVPTFSTGTIKKEIVYLTTENGDILSTENGDLLEV